MDGSSQNGSFAASTAVGSAAAFAFQTAIMEHILRGGRGSTVLDEVCRKIEEIVPHCVCSIMVRDRVSGKLDVLAAPSLPAQAIRELDGLEPGEFAGSCGTAAFTGIPAIIGDTRTDPRWEGMQDFAINHGIRACWSVPVPLDADFVLGTFAISRTVPGSPDPATAEILQAAGHVVGLAILQEQSDRDSNDRNQLLRAVVEGSGDAISVRNLEGQFVYCNEAGARSLGMPIDQLIGRTVVDLFHPEAARRSSETDQEVIRTGTSLLTTFSGREVIGSDRTLQVRKFPRLDHAGKVIGVISITRDLTEKVKAERAMQQMQKLESIGVLANGIAHDFNNILVGILGNAEWALGRVGDDQALRTSLAEIRQAALRAADLTRQIMAYSGQGSFEREAVDVEELVRDVLSLVGGAISREARIEVVSAKGLPTVVADPTQLRQVVMNLVVNASDALEGRAGAIDIDLARAPSRPEAPISTIGGPLVAGDFLRINVKDEGIGMDALTLERIFDPFFTTKREGRGIGLAAVLGILHAHGGGIAVESLPGQGALFSVFVPVKDSNEDAPVPEGSRPLALVVDDEGLVRKTARRLLETGGFRVLTAAHPEEALRVHAEAGADVSVALIDVNLDGASGIELARRLRAQREDLPIVLTTGGLGAPAGHDELGAQILRKPFTRSELLEIVDRARSRAR